MASPPLPTKKGLLVAVAVVLASVLLVGVVAFAAADWRTIGATAEGDEVLVSSISPQKNGLRTAWIRMKFKQPTKLPQGGPFVELRARVRFNCVNGSAMPNSEWFYSVDHSGKRIVSKKMRRDDQFGQPAEGLRIGFVCKQKSKRALISGKQPISTGWHLGNCTTTSNHGPSVIF